MRRLSPHIIKLSLLASLLVGWTGLCAEGKLLESNDVKPTMRRIFEYHVDQKRMTPELLKRSLHVYIDHFDRERVYLTASEVEPFLNPSNALLNQMSQDYDRGELSVFADLDTVIRNAIIRHRKSREDLENDLGALFAHNEHMDIAPRYPKPSFAKSEVELRERTKEKLLLFIQVQKKKEEGCELVQNQKKVISLYERNVQAREDDYLNIDAEGRALNAEEIENGLTLRTLKAMAKSLDSHTAFFSAQEAYDMRVRLEKGFHGIGIVLQESIEGVTVVRLLEGGPADRCGMLADNDRIVEVDGISIKDYSFDKVLDLIRGQEGSTLVLGVLRTINGDSQVFNVELQRERITMDDSRVDMSYEEVEGGIIGKLTLHSFYDGENGISSERDIRNGIRELYQKGNLKGLVLDLRDNTGGFLMQAVKVAGLFITNGVVVISKYSDGETRYFRDIDGHAYYDGPLILLTSKASASAAEIVAQTLQDYGAALIVGDKRTYGKGSIQHQTVTGRDSDSFFKVTVGRYYTVSGQSTQIDGVHADIVVPTAFADEQIGEKFLEYPLATGTMDPAFNDNLSDIDPAAKRWYLKYYMPSLQPRELQYTALLQVLRQRSHARLMGNDKYTSYLNFARGDDAVSPAEDAFFNEISADPDKVDPPMAEAVDIMRDIIDLLPETGSLDKLFKK